ncbi:MAG: hypothetical protein R3B09_00230 [Nannocystaceae bacterium]
MHAPIHQPIASTLLTALSVAMLPACEVPHTVDDTMEVMREITPTELGLGDGWSEVEPGLWTRPDEDGGQQFAGIGEPGRQHAIASLEVVEDELRVCQVALFP